MTLQREHSSKRSAAAPHEAQRCMSTEGLIHHQLLFFFFSPLPYGRQNCGSDRYFWREIVEGGGLPEELLLLLGGYSSTTIATASEMAKEPALTTSEPAGLVRLSCEAGTMYLWAGLSPMFFFLLLTHTHKDGTEETRRRIEIGVGKREARNRSKEVPAGAAGAGRDFDAVGGDRRGRGTVVGGQPAADLQRVAALRRVK